MGIIVPVEYSKGKKKLTVFKNGWNSEQMGIIEEKYHCCFAYKNYARRNCYCQIDNKYNTEERFGNVDYVVEEKYTLEGGFDTYSGNGTENCSECKSEFVSFHKGLIISCLILDYIFLAFIVICCIIAFVIVRFKERYQLIN